MRASSMYQDDPGKVMFNVENYSAMKRNSNFAFHSMHGREWISCLKHKVLLVDS
jgi:hypothetical protein